jgi:hypothetical protein
VNATAASAKRTPPFVKNAWLSLLGGLTLALALVGGATAHWTATGAGSGSGSVATLAAPALGGSRQLPDPGRADLGSHLR